MVNPQQKRKEQKKYTQKYLVKDVLHYIDIYTERTLLKINNTFSFLFLILLVNAGEDSLKIAAAG